MASVMIPHQNVSVQLLMDGNVETCQYMLNAAVSSKPVLHVYEIAWDVSECQKLINLGLSYSGYLGYYLRSIMVSLSYDSLTSPKRRYKMCRREKFIQYVSQDVKTRFYTCFCNRNCIVTIRVSFPFPTGGILHNMAICEISVVQLECLLPKSIRGLSLGNSISLNS